MSHRLITYLASFLILASVTMGMCILSTSDLELTTDLFAAESNASLSVTCVDPTVVAFTPNIAYTMTIPVVSRTAAFSPSAVTFSAVLSNSVNGDSNPSVSYSASDSMSIRFYHTGPMVKIGGVQCSTNSAATLQANGDGGTSPAYKIAIQDEADTAFHTSNEIQNRDATNKLTLFGTDGAISGAALSDGSDADGFTNGEIAFGGSDASSGYRIFSSVGYLGGFNPDNLSEIITYTFTPN